MPIAQMSGEGSEASEWKGGELLFCGATDWAMIGRGNNKPKKGDPPVDPSRADKYPNLVSPTRLKALQGINVVWVASGPAACHSVIGDDEGRCWTWGRNEKGQLGHGDLAQRNVPTIVKALAGKRVISGSAGKHHTAVVTSDGESYTWGSNLVGQCGTGSIKSKDKSEELLLSPVKAHVEGTTKVACGQDFTVWICKQRLWSAGNPQYGQLGHGTDHEYNAKDTSVKICYQPQPTPKAIAALAGANIVNIACGHTHSLAVDDSGVSYTWGNGGYGRLGHKEQKDDFAPRKLETLSGRVSASADSKIACGSTSSFATTNTGLFAWGKLKTSGDNNMYPRIFEGLMGWTIKDIACGAQHFAVTAQYQDEHSTITWGHATSGELGYGPKGKKSSANPDKVPDLEGADTKSVAAGQAHTLFLVDPASIDLDKLDSWAPETEVEEAAAPPAGASGKAAGGKRKAKGDGPAAKKSRGKN